MGNRENPYKSKSWVILAMECFWLYVGDQAEVFVSGIGVSRDEEKKAL